MEIIVFKIISTFFLIWWIVFMIYIIDITTDTKQYEKITISIVLLGICAFLYGVCMGILM